MRLTSCTKTIFREELRCAIKNSGMYLISLMTVGLLLAQTGRTQEEPSGTAVVSNVFYETDLREVLLNLSNQTGVPIIADQTVHGYITIEFSRIPLEECLSRVLEPLGYSYIWSGNYYLVGKAHPDNPSFPLLTTSEAIVPSYLKVSELVNLISDYYKPYVKADAQANRLTITASPDIIAQFKQDLATIDIPSRQVTIEALVTEVSDEYMRELGVSAEILGSTDNRTGVIRIPLGEVSDSSLVVSTRRPNDRWGDWKVDYQTAVKALLTEGKANIRANPKLTTVEGQMAKIFIGKDQYYTIATGVEPYVYTRLEVIKVGIALEITPYVATNGDITVDVKSIVSDVTGMGATGLPVINTRDVRTKITVRDGESIVIGGLQTEDDRKTVKKVPLLGDIPLLGHLFRNTKVERNKSQIVIMVTPHLLTGGSVKATAEVIP